jgi:hypothetical protein
MNKTQCEVRVLVKGRVVTEFEHEGEVYIEGREGSEFEIEVRNKTHQRVLAVISVDGLSVIDGKSAGIDSPGYTVNAFQTIRIPGWKLATGDQAAKFTFGSRSSSYVSQASGSATNCGVIGVMLWSEKEKPQVFIKSPVTRGVLPGDYWLGAMTNCGPTYGNVATSLGGSILGAASAATYSAKMPEVTLSASVTAASTEAPAPLNNLGTEFGQATSFKTSETTFERDSVTSTVVMYYDDARGLKARGIVLDRPVVTRSNVTPNPFPGIGCAPPKGWKG